MTTTVSIHREVPDDHNEPVTIGYRRDIDGLRAIAVCAVVFFHAGGEASSGFLGVDIFFVISGYLITSIIVREVRAGQFSLAHFYERRIRRIFPALFVMLAATSVVGYRLLAPDELKLLAQSLIAAAVFSSNFFFWSQTGYFDAPSEAHPLLHTWSLAIEEQFYLIFPLLLLMAARRSWSYARAILAVAALFSFAGAVWLHAGHPDAAFYASPARAWELLLGSVVALGLLPPMKSQSAREVASLVSLLVLAACLALAQSGFKVLGVPALLPCLATAILIHAGSTGAARSTSLLCSAPFVGVGRISYSLYLWHWPVLVFGRVHLERSVTGATLGALVLAMVLLAVASYYLVERPWRRTNGLLGSRGTFALAGAVVAAAVAFGAIVIHNGGFANRYPGTFELAPTNYRAPHCMLGAHQKQSGWAGAECLVNDVRSPVVMFWGDSYSAHYIPAILKRRADLRFNILQYNLGACAPVLGYDMAGRSDCRIFNDAAQSIIERFGVRTVVLAANWSGYKGRGSSLEPLSQTISALQSRGLKVVLIGQSPSFHIPVPKIYWWRTRKAQAFRPEFEAATEVAINVELKRIAGSALFIDPSLAFCRADKCLIGEADNPYFVDKGHFTEAGGQHAIRSFWEQLEQFVLKDQR